MSYGYALADQKMIDHDVWDRLMVVGATALIDSGCLHVKGGLTLMMADSLALNGDGKIYATDTVGHPRYGANGLMTADELAAEAKASMPMSWPQGR